MDRERWRLDEDQIASAVKLLEAGQIPGNLGPYEFQIIPISAQPGYEAFAFCNVDALKQHKDRAREILLDSTCEKLSARKRKSRPEFHNL